MTQLSNTIVTDRRDQRVLCCAPRASGLAPDTLLDHACSVPQNPRSSRAELSRFIARAFASVCGSPVPLRSGSASLNAPLRHRSTSARRPQTEAVCPTMPIGHIGALRLFISLGHLDHLLQRIRNPRPEPSVTNALCVSLTGLLVVPLSPFRPRPFCYTLRPFVTGPLFVFTADAGLPSAARQRRYAPASFR